MTPFNFYPAKPPGGGERQIVVPPRETKAALFAFLRQALPLPDYFGDNWDALDECLDELAQGASGKIILIHHDIPLAATPDEQRIYLQVLADAIRSGPHLAVHFPAESQVLVERIMPE